jgi:hypothetical protein
MAKHRFDRLVYEGIAVAGVQCVRCSQIALYINAEIPEYILEQECPATPEDFSQAAARIVRQATEETGS